MIICDLEKPAGQNFLALLDVSREENKTYARATDS
jgi:hypothetical protein